MDERTSPPSAHRASVDGANLDQGRRYWKAAIAHLAPEKREAAWEFYLDRLESSAAAGAIVGCTSILCYQHFRTTAIPTNYLASARESSLPRGQTLRVEVWNNPSNGQRKGSVVSFSRVVSTERTQDGGVRIYVLTPVEEVRENVRSLQQLAR